MPTPTWSSPVRYAEVDQQGVVFNAHYLTYCDEALAALLTRRLGSAEFGDRVMLKSSTLTWSRGARAGDRVDVHARCTGVGTTSISLEFTISVGAQVCCTVQTAYVHVDGEGRPAPVPDRARAALTAP